MTETVEATVEAANENGLKINGEWANYTKQEWRKQPWEDAQRGDRVKLAVSDTGFIYAIKVLSSAPSNGASPSKAGTGFRSPENMNRRDALEFAVAYAASQSQAQTASDVVLNAEFFLTFLEPGEESAPPSGNPFDEDMEVPFR